jgi:NADH-quinone oxidoreductase subunit F
MEIIMERYIVTVGMGTCGIATGANRIYDLFLKIKDERNLDFVLNKSGCIGMCHNEVLVFVEKTNSDGEKIENVVYGKVLEEDVLKIIESHLLNNTIINEKIILDYDKKIVDNTIFDKQKRIALRNCGIIDPVKIDDYLKNDGYKALKKAISMSQDDVIKEVKESGLKGRGGGGFLTGLKWELAKKNESETKYFICNGDEGDPGAFMDRSLLEGDPHTVLEGMAIGAYAIGANKGIIYVRAEYPLAVKNLKIAIDDARKMGFLGKNIFKSSFSFDIYIKEGAGAFVCGEETALIASVEGKRGMPRFRPPYPAEKGAFNYPTNINNVETLANIAWIINNGAKEYSKYGKNQSKGTKVFALAGKINKGGLIEIPMGLTIKEVIYDIGGGIKNNKNLKAVQFGGPSGGCLPASLIDTTIEYDTLQNTGAIIGSGGMIVMDEDTCMVDIAKYFMSFIQDESCGKCTFCRVGTKRMLEILTKITEGKATMNDFENLKELASNVKISSLCGLGQTAPNPVLTTIKYFEEEYIEHIKEKKCRAKKCKELIKYLIIEDKCIGCHVCYKKCPVKAITGNVKEKHIINQDLCIKCGICKQNCKFDAIIVE